MKSRSGLLARACLQALHFRSVYVAASATAALFATDAVFAEDRFSREVEFDIPAQALETALLEFSRQADVQVMVGSTAVSGLKSTTLKGRWAIARALDSMLRNTGLAYDATGNTVTVRPTVANSASPPVLHLGEAPAGGAALATFAAGETATPRHAEPSRTTSPTVEMLDEVIVTGTHIRGEAGAGSQVIVLERSDIDASGYNTVQDVLNTLPQNFGGAPSEDFNSAPSGNFNRGTGLNLRGLGADATLVLVNGRRQAVSGTEGYFVDVSSIPTSAVERIEVLTDGASAIYGSDAVGGVVNIVLRKEYDGAETRVRAGSADEAGEWSASQILGTSWTSGNALLGYQYNERDSLARADRPYAASADQRRHGGDDFRVIYCNPGNILDPLTFVPAFAIPPGQDGTALTPSDLLAGEVNLQDPLEGGDLYPQQQVHAAFITATQRLGERVSLSADARYAERSTEMSSQALPAILSVPPTNPFYVDAFGDGSPLLMSYSMVDDLGPISIRGRTETMAGTLGATIDLTVRWRLQVAGTYAREKMNWTAANLYDFDALPVALGDTNPATAFNPFADGSATNPATLDGLRMEQHERSRSTASSFSLLADGPVFDLPAGSAKLAVGVDYRDERLETGAATPTDLSHDVLAGFAELAVPLLAGTSPEVEPALELSLAGRYEEYSDFGSTSDPKVGLNWRPLRALQLRTTWGTSFKAPRLVDVNETLNNTYAQLTSYPDPQSPFGSSIVLVRAGKNAALQQETATIWTAGFDLKFESESAPALSMTYFDIDFDDRIAEGGPPGDPFSILLQEAQWAPIIQRNPSRSDVAAICNSPEFLGDPASCAVTPPAAIIDLRLRNFGSLHVQGFDFSLTGHVPMEAGGIDLGLSGTHLLEYEVFATDRSPGFDVVDTVGNPPALRLRGFVSWRSGGWSASAFINHTGAYADDISDPQRKIDAWTTLDLHAAYVISSEGSWLDGTEFALNATNVLDDPPPFVNSLSGYDTVNADLIGRVISAQVTKSW
jgi:iron complex outermembrane receptor protein